MATARRLNDPTLFIEIGGVPNFVVVSWFGGMAWTCLMYVARHGSASAMTAAFERNDLAQADRLRRLWDAADRWLEVAPPMLNDLGDAMSEATKVLQGQREETAEGAVGADLDPAVQSAVLATSPG